MAELLRRAAAMAAPIGLASVMAAPAYAASSEINTADTAWMIVATALVLMMTIPGLALFYSGMVRKKNVLATMAQSLAAVTMISILWVAFGYSLCFVGDGPWLGTLDRWFLAGMTMDSVNPAAKTIPESLFMLYQMTFAIITVALVAGSVADLPGARVRGNDLDRLLGDVGGDRDLDPQLRQEVHDILRAAVDFGVALLTAVALHLGHGHAVDANRRQGLTDLIELEGFDDRDDEFHGQAYSPGCAAPHVPGAASIWHLSGQMA